ncbi:MAG: pilus assembly protein [Betaproteobacteria bacterium]|nr:pilus assembly protein [Betaproteobacteria bacterium]
MNFKQQSRTYRPRQGGFALAEMALALPLFLLIAWGALNLSAQLHSKLLLDTQNHNAALSPEQLPPTIRRASHWPEKTQTALTADKQSNTTPAGLFRPALEQWLCQRHQPVRGFTLGHPSSINTDWLLEQLEQVRNHALGAQRAACLLEASARWGPHSSLGLLLAMSTLPAETARKQSISSFCPATAGVGEFARRGVALQGLKSQLSAVIPERKKAMASAQACE